MSSSASETPIFPLTTPSTILSCQFSSWYPKFRTHSIKSTIIRPLSRDFCDYLHADGVFVPEGSEDVPFESELSDDEDEDSDDSDDPDAARKFTFPELDAQIRACVKEYGGGVFPKLNFSSPKDAAWVLPQSSPLKCTSPADVYLLLKSSDFISHDLSPEIIFEGCSSTSSTSSESAPKPDLPAYELELILRKWYPVDRSREFRCFVRENRLIGISQRDPNYYDFMNEPTTQTQILTAIQTFFSEHVHPKMLDTAHYTFDFLLTRDLSRGHIIDFNPFAPRTDPLLFTYEELLDIFLTSQSGTPKLAVIDSRAHPAANRKAPTNQHNMLPFDALKLSDGKDITEFAEAWREEVEGATQV